MQLVHLLLLAAVASLAIAQEAKESASSKDQDAETLPSAESNRDKRGFIITPLSAIPASVLAPLLPYLKATLPPQILTKVAAFLPPAHLVTAPADLVATSPELPAILSATAPLIADRAAAVATPVQPVPSVVTAQRLTAAPVVQTVNAGVLAAQRLTAAPVIQSAPVVATQRLTAAPLLPAAPPTVPNPQVVAVSRLSPVPTSSFVSAAQVASPIYPAGAPLYQQYAYASPTITYPDGFTAARLSARSGLFPAPALFTPNFANPASARFLAPAAVPAVKTIAPAGQISTFQPFSPNIFAARYASLSPTTSLPQNGPLISAARTSSPVVVPQSSLEVVQPQFAPSGNLVSNYYSPLAQSVYQVNGAPVSTSTFLGTAPGRLAVVTN